MKEKIVLITVLCFLLQISFFATALADKPSSIMLAKQYHQGIDVKQYWVSEKLDGIRARWDGQKLISKNGYAFSAPTWFTHRFTNDVMEGELWIARNRYEETSSVTSKSIADTGWSDIRLMLFDLPEHKGDFTQRYLEMQKLVKSINSPYLSVIKQFRVASHIELMEHLQSVVAAGGEGLMLHHQASRYSNGRSENLLKLKLFEDAEAIVIGYKPGKGKFKGLLGSIKVRNSQGKEFNIGSGFNLQQRQNPPALLSRITYKYNGLTKNGVPRFPVFLRVRSEK
jgi:DNA ligase